MIILKQSFRRIKEKTGTMDPKFLDSLADTTIRTAMKNFRGATGIDKMLFCCEIMKTLTYFLNIADPESVKMSKELNSYSLKKKKYISLLPE
jgi:hypothetical protein